MTWAVFLARREFRRAPQLLVFNALHGTLAVDGQLASTYAIQWRGPCGFVMWRDSAGKRHDLAFWPDRLSASARRSLRLVQQRTQLQNAQKASPWRWLMAP